MRTALVAVVVALLAALGCTHAWAAAATVDRARLAESETLDLRIRVEGTGDAEPDLAPLARDFEVLSNSRNSRISIINGRGESYTEWAISLAPRRAGTLEIPSLAVGGERTAAIAITVTPDDSTAAAPGTQDITLEVTPDQKEVHVQQQLLLTVRLQHAVDLANGATLAEPAIDNAVVRKIGEGSYERRIGGRRFGVFERRYAVFPQASGELVVPRLQFDATLGGSSWFDRFGSAGKRVRLRSQEQRIRVLAPESGADPWLPARLLTVVETWDRSPNELRIGESVTRTLTLTANGLTAAQLPALPVGAVDGLRLYPDKPEMSDETADDGISGTRIERSAVIPQRAGDLQLPELRLRWWDTINRRFEEAVVPGRTIRVQGTNASEPPAAPASRAEAETAAAAPMPATTPEPGAALRGWQAACAVLAALAAFSMLQCRRAARGARASTGTPPAHRNIKEAELFSELRAACQRHEATTVPGLLLDWARSALPGAGVRALADLPARLHSQDLRMLLNALQASRYAGATVAWDGAPLAECLNTIRSQLAAQRSRGPDAALPPLYRRDDGNTLSG